MLAYEELQRQKNQGKEQQEKVDLIANIESVVIKAEKMTDDVKDETISSNRKVSGIRENRAVEKDKRREREGFELAKQEEVTNNFEVAGTKAEDSEQSKSLQPDHMEILRQKRRERKHGQRE